ncbi:hypothetical protein LCR01_01380 [Companilactobacillus crustorum]|uniref:Uncharacterized protein n=3 Tax=Companilactobacillus TaxID=2767879 RepID=A0A837RL76_9LACO|nr:hypothetical protein [Companilactobacillus crustorum]HCD06891.1 hypothetical protein [Lactobacillus sp.]APU70818.1 hypothetical protein BI355_0466 [Companilactobacillus crustorum]KRK44173.1 hypothetical protein FD26_GL001126 [Companilactobacillus crustorum JCM 15951]KRO21548.1 hypothetical protein IV63_GL001234 [Companilactobacillus crustorum]WDT64966.1 hypothetical protein NV391_08310 [Companilactobacillus crustorum]
MIVDNLEGLQKATDTKAKNIKVIKTAFDFCDKIHQAQISGSGVDWSIAATGGWLALVTGFNHKIHRLFMNQEKKSAEDLQHIISKDYIIKKTDKSDEYELILR